MYKDRDFEPKRNPAGDAVELKRDLELETLLRAMAGDDPFLLEVVTNAVFASLREPEEIFYRQKILADCQQCAEIVRGIYGIAVEAIEGEKRIWGWMSSKYPESTLHWAVEVLQLFVGVLKRLRQISDGHAAEFRSEGFRRFFEMIANELNDPYLRLIEQHLERLKFRDGTLITAELGPGNQGIHYVLRKPQQVTLSWIDRVQGWFEQTISGKNDSSTYEVDDRDEAGYRALSDLRGQGICHVAAALAQSTNHILNFFIMLRRELAFYVGCLNLQDSLTRKLEPLCFPQLLPGDRHTLVCKGLYDVCLSLRLNGRAVGNDVTADGVGLLVITGANRGGKSTFLRSVGLAQLMMQCGMFVAAEAFRADLCDLIFTHFKREEDISMKSGKLDEELSRMSAIVGKLTPRSLVLFNESFSSTNEREGSEIARQIVHALLEAEVKVIYVTHMFDLAHGFYAAKQGSSSFLRAERLPDGQRTFRLFPGEPLPTSHGEDLYRRIFRREPEQKMAVVPSHEIGAPR
jgi:hypothetical protein